MKLYIAGKVMKNSSFGTHYWRDNFCNKLIELSGLDLAHIDPLISETTTMTPEQIFTKNCRQIRDCDVVIAYLSDDIGVGGAQEILIARYLHKPVIGLAPRGGKFNGAKREMFGRLIKDYKDPFVFTTCDIVCDTIEAVAKTLKDPLPVSTGLQIIDAALEGDDK